MPAALHIASREQDQSGTLQELPVVAGGNRGDHSTLRQPLAFHGGKKQFVELWVVTIRSADVGRGRTLRIHLLSDTGDEPWIVLAPKEELAVREQVERFHLFGVVILTTPEPEYRNAIISKPPNPAR